MGEYKPTTENKEDKMKEAKLTIHEIQRLELEIAAQVEQVIKSFNDEILSQFRDGKRNFEDEIKEVYDDNNWIKQPGYAYKGGRGLRLPGGFTEEVLSNVKYNLGMRDSSNQFFGAVVRRSMEKEPRLKAYIDAVIYGVRKQHKIAEECGIPRYYIERNEKEESELVSIT